MNLGRLQKELQEIPLVTDNDSVPPEPAPCIYDPGDLKERLRNERYQDYNELLRQVLH